MTQQDHDGKDENGIPSQEDNTVYTYQDPNFNDYTRLPNFTKNTGIEADDFSSFALKELIDNAADFLEEYYKESSNNTISVYISNDKTVGFRIAVINPNDRDLPIFPITYMKKTFNYLGAFSSKSNQYRITRGAQGIALKQLGVLGYVLYGKNWDQPIIFQHNGRIDNVYVDVDRKHTKIIPRFENGALVDSTDTKIVVTIPTISIANYAKLKEYCKEYTLFNIHIGYKFYFDDDEFIGPSIDLPAQHPISKDFKNPNSIYCYSDDEFYDFLNDISNDSNDMTFYKAVSGFREIKQKDDRFEYLKNMELEEHLTEQTAKKVFMELRASMQAMSKISDPYDADVKKRKDALLDRYLQIKPRGLDIDVERAVYVRTKDPKTKGDRIHKNDKNNTRFPYRFEVLAIPIKGEETKSIIISGVNYSTSINNKSYFTSNNYVYGWIHKRTRNFLQAWNIEGIIKCAMAGHDIDDNESIPSEKRKQECVIICHLVAPKIAYSNGYGKSSLVLEPFSQAIPETIEEAILKIPSKPRYTGLCKNESKRVPKLPKLVYELLLDRWNAVILNPSILDPNSEDYDPWSLSTVWYHLREEELLPLENKYQITIIKEGTRKAVTEMVSEICESLPGNPKREQLGIYASPRATMYFRGSWFGVDIRDIPQLSEKGAVVLFVEKRGVVDQIKHIADRYGIAIVNTQGHLSEYAKDLIPKIIEKDGYVAILTDFDCAGISIAEKAIKEIIDEKILSEETVNNKVKRLGIVPEDLDYFLENLSDPNIKTRQQLQKKVEEPYPRQSKEEKQQQPGTNVVNPIIEFAADYYIYDQKPGWGLVQKYKRYEYIYNNFQYLTGLKLGEIITNDYFKSMYEKDGMVKRIINRAMTARDPRAARRIELDSVIKVVRANLFGEFVIDKLVKFFPEWNYNRVIELPTEYIAEKFHTLPKNIKESFIQVFNIADESAEPKEKEIRSEFKNIKGTLSIDVEEAENERLISEAVASNPKMQKVEARCVMLLNLLLQQDDHQRTTISNAKVQIGYQFFDVS